VIVVMDVLVATQLAAQILLHDNAMLKALAIVDLNRDVAISVKPSR
jgi:hypothetical protein